MRVLVVCDQGNNRSVTIAHHLKYWGHDVLPVGLKTNAPDTLRDLQQWADRVIVVEEWMLRKLTPTGVGKAEVWELGPDTYPRPFHNLLKVKVARLMEEHRSEYAPVS